MSGPKNPFCFSGLAPATGGRQQPPHYQFTHYMRANRLPALILTLCLPHPSVPAAPLGPTFTYQGRLAEGGQPPSGSYDLKFTLFATADGASLAGGPLTNTATTAASGLFTVTLDFGAGVFDGSERWLEIGVRPGLSTGDFTTLTPRQSVRPTPYAVYAAAAAGAAAVTGPVPASQITGTLSPTSIGAGSIAAMQLASGAAFSNLYAGGQSGVASGGIIFSEQANNEDLLNAGYVKIGKLDRKSTRLNSSH